MGWEGKETQAHGYLVTPTGKRKTSLCWPKPKILRTQVWLNKHPQHARHFRYMLILFLHQPIYLHVMDEKPSSLINVIDLIRSTDLTQVLWVHVYTYLEVPIPDLVFLILQGEVPKNPYFYWVATFMIFMVRKTRKKIKWNIQIKFVFPRQSHLDFLINCWNS